MCIRDSLRERMGCPQSRLADDRPVTTRDVDVRRSEPGLADAPDTAAKRTSIDDDERHEAMSDRDFEADRARLAKARKKRLAVAVEALASDAAVTVVPKDEAAVRLILRNFEARRLDPSARRPPSRGSTRGTRRSSPLRSARLRAIRRLARPPLSRRQSRRPLARFRLHGIWSPPWHLRTLLALDSPLYAP